MFATIMLLAALRGAAPGVPGTALAPVQEHAEQAAAGAEEQGEKFDILHHIQDSHEIELPFGRTIHLPEAGSWMVGPVDMTPTKHVVFLGLAALIVLAILLPAA